MRRYFAGFKLRPYGVRVIRCPDMGDLREMASKSSNGLLPKRSGDFPSVHSSKSKRSTRRYWKRKARAEWKKLVRNYSCEEII